MPRKRLRRLAKNLRFLGKCAFENGKNRLLRKLVHDDPRHVFGLWSKTITRSRPPPPQKQKRLFRRLFVPCGHAPKNMARIRRRNACNLHQPALDKAAQRLLLHPCADNLAHGSHTFTNALKKRRLTRLKPPGLDPRHGPHEPPVIFPRCALTELRIKGAMHDLRCLHRHKRNRQNPPRPKHHTALEALTDEMHLAIPTKAKGPHRHGLNHSAIGTNTRPFGINRRTPIAQNSYIRRRAANVRDKRILRPGHPPRPHN